MSGSSMTIAIKDEPSVSAEETIKQFGYMMTEKVKKDLIDKKSAKSSIGTTASRPITSFTDFMCAVTLTNTNSMSGSRIQLEDYL